MGKAKQCDRCGGFYPYSNEWYDGEVVVLKTIKMSNFGAFSQKDEICWDLCPNCTAKLNQWLNEGKDFKED